MIWLILLNIAAQVADYASTKYILKNGLNEENAITLRFIQKFGMTAWLIAKIILATWAVLAWYPIIIPGILTALLFFGVAIYNWRLVK